MTEPIGISQLFANYLTVANDAINVDVLTDAVEVFFSEVQAQRKSDHCLLLMFNDATGIAVRGANAVDPENRIMQITRGGVARILKTMHDEGVIGSPREFIEKFPEGGDAARGAVADTVMQFLEREDAWSSTDDQ
jgi:hypothetical protein